MPKSKKGLCVHLKGDEINVVDIALKTDNDVESLFECERKGEIFKYDVISIQNEIATLNELEMIIKEHDEIVKRAKKEQEALKLAIKNEMESRNIKSIDMGDMKITLIADSVRKTLDSKKLFAEHPEINENDYMKETVVKGSIKITIRKDKE